MIESQFELDMYPMVKNRSVINLIPTRLYLDWINYIRGSNVGLGLNELEPISFLIKDFDDKSDFEYWLGNNFQILFDIRLNYPCIDKSQWPGVRTFEIFNQWFEVRHSDLIIDLETGPIEIG